MPLSREMRVAETDTFLAYESVMSLRSRSAAHGYIERCTMAMAVTNESRPIFRPENNNNNNNNNNKNQLSLFFSRRVVPIS